MRKIMGIGGLAVMLLLAGSGSFAKTPVSPKEGPGTIVIVFKDGHRQTFNLADVLRVEFPTAPMGSGDISPMNPLAPPRGHFLGKWECGDGNGGNFYITLLENGDAKRSIGNVHGRWVYVNGEAHITWDDGAMDAIRKVGSRDRKSAYAAGKSFNDNPDNVTDAHNTSKTPI